MAGLPPSPFPDDPTAPRWKRVLQWVVTYVLPSLLGGVSGGVCGAECAKGASPEASDQRAEDSKTPASLSSALCPLSSSSHGPPPEARAFGWRGPRADVLALNRDSAQTLQFCDTPAGRRVFEVGEDADVFLWRMVRRACGKEPTAKWYPNVNQNPVGCCVGTGWKHSGDVTHAVQIVLANKPFEFKPLSAEVMYGGSREAGGDLGGGDGSFGRWAAEWARDGGVVPMEKVGGIDLGTFSPARAREYATRGVPAELKKVAKDFPVKSTALVKSWADVKKAISQGYPVAVCSMQGFGMTRDAQGWARPSGTWPHCMAIIGVRTSGGKEGAFILNSWGDSAHTGGVWPEDMPVAGFWADSATVGKMVAEGDSFALSDAVGFPSRRVDWFVQPAPRELARRPSVAEFALSP